MISNNSGKSLNLLLYINEENLHQKEIIMFFKAYKLIKTIKGVVDTAEVVIDAVKSVKDKK